MAALFWEWESLKKNPTKMKLKVFRDIRHLILRNGLQQRRNSWQDGTFGTTCPIPPRRNFTYALQAKDQIGTYFYFPSLSLHKAAGAYGSIKVYSRPGIPVPYAPPAGDHVVLAGDWFKRSQRVSPSSALMMMMISLLFFHN